MNAKDVNVYLTIDREQEGWDGHVGFVPTYLKEIGFDTNKVALVCGPPIMIKFVLQGLEELGFTRTQVYTTLELRMKCVLVNADVVISDLSTYVKMVRFLEWTRSINYLTSTKLFNLKKLSNK